MKYLSTLLLVSLITISLTSFILDKENELAKKDKWTNLLGEDYKQYWEVFIGVPHASVTGIDGVDTNSNGVKGKPLGLNNDPKKVFSFEKIEGEIMLHISGEIYGAVSSKSEYENYHLQMQFKWADKKWEPRLDKPRDSGILYHCNSEHGAFWNVWMASQEFQVQEGDCGDYYSLTNTFFDIPVVRAADSIEYDYKIGAPLKNMGILNKYPNNHCNRLYDNEKQHGEWNTLDLLCLGDSSLHIVNGKVVMALFNSKFQDANGEIVPLTKGNIQLQSEGAEMYYKGIKIKPLKEIPAKYKKQF